ncbi:TlpA family protein disulfide reductase [Zunongwangia sp. HRR-M8]|uniref:TlpA family protein disulfide reductase n=1 Tax=Zunongwangia sp. HRR-M8 TaxID=3015170 RepID=UPI0022DDBCA1|nr:TlpA disulfide reductase family protein [Zunongwangia sp. HRR-M8]WBL21590.1 TlpA disulfide reductase family protein [Zunongwangia sp. HRR-M8]
MKKLFQNQWVNIILVVIILAMVLPQTRKPIAIVFNKLIASSPKLTDEEDRQQIESYNWILEDRFGNNVDFAQFQDKVILINYWATWCPPCIAEMPSLNDLYQDYKEKVVFLFISGEALETSQGFMNAKGYNLPVYRMKTNYPDPLEGYKLPTSYLIDKNGTIVIKKEGAADWNSANFRNILDQLLKN